MNTYSIAITILIVLVATGFVYAAILVMQSRKKWPAHQQKNTLISKDEISTSQTIEFERLR